MTKGIGERLLWSINRRQTATKFSVYRWGNVLGSRGSALHAFAKSLKEKGAANLTDPRMTRFWIRIDDAVDFMLETYRNASADTAMIPPMKAAPVAAIVDAVATHLRVKKFRIDVVGIRPGEKIHETIESNHEYCIRSDTSETFDADQLRVLVSEALAC
jgi:UDP-N-acetylglucosamine 4,6-dehydratase